MSQFEVSMLVVKPDGVERGLVDPIRQILIRNGLVIKREVRKTLKPATVEMLYWNISDVRHRDYFSELVAFMSSSPVHIFIVDGYDAVNKVRQIIGKRVPASGIRSRWAESIIRNVAHGPHTPARAKREIQLLMEDYSMKKVFVIGGMSESGKSTLGRYLDQRGIKRLKITFFLKRAMEREGVNGDFVEWNNQNMKERPEWVFRTFADEFIPWITDQGIEFCCLESLYSAGLGVHLRKRLGPDKVVIVYVDMDEDIRLQRQMIRQNLTSLDEARKLMLPRDQIKREWGVPAIADVADIIIDNSDSMENLTRIADAMIARHCPELFI
ncbi:MAG: nucleoside-diphosphate kinase [Candidatus Pacebacteria bacterium]|nr:nucleoside-diphosphate kinase [Candidatus Paceibacterota bacterium]MDD3072398.1 nucleoside-diphosphate kinase [Candidatus Paceibacterota bacterium]MDD3729011.1 nucleoside-diphosphate kinase [Candidatus Paceibacterota bacterium]MDD4201618.1 nucleoside-diphosphate kinase [Candidatus Paceibacterota bacterium]MDD4467429.1 nucleoside-diphosphate kinase [Candidatus Paceibacterota bacterium]